MYIYIQIDIYEYNICTYIYIYMLVPGVLWEGTQARDTNARDALAGFRPTKSTATRRDDTTLGSKMFNSVKWKLSLFNII